MKRRGTRQEGFTLVELLIVIIIGILAAIAIPMFLNQRGKAEDASPEDGIHSIQIGVQSYALDHSDNSGDGGHERHAGRPRARLRRPLAQKPVHQRRHEGQHISGRLHPRRRRATLSASRATFERRRLHRP